MKRWTWLLLAIFCAALGQVRAVDRLDAKAKPCPCCHPGACGTPGCCPSPASANPAMDAAEFEPVASRPAARQARLAHERLDPAHLSFTTLAAFGRRPGSGFERTPAANVPLFRAHCSLRI